MSDFPALVYKASGKYVRPHGTYDFTGVVDADELAKKLADGWFTSIEAAVEAKKPIQKPVEPVSSPVLDDNAPPTRQELEAKATELGIKFDGRYSDKRLALLIEEALEK
jgi:trehalose/maltose hydrolase-like predicted phosphorylase